MRATIRPYEMTVFSIKAGALIRYCAEKAWDMDKLTSEACRYDLQMLIADAAQCLVDTGDHAGVLEAFYGTSVNTLLKREDEGFERRSFVVKPGKYIVAIDENGGTYTCLSNTIDDLFTYGRSIETQLLMKLPSRSRRVVLWLLSALVAFNQSPVLSKELLYDVIYALMNCSERKAFPLKNPQCKKA